MKIKLRLNRIEWHYYINGKFEFYPKFGYENVFPSRTGFILEMEWF